MLARLLNLVLLGAVIPVGYPGELGLPRSSTLQVRCSTGTAWPESMLARLVPEELSGEHEYLDDNDNSDESSSANERMPEFCGSMSRSARYTVPTPDGASLPLFYAFCTLLL